MTKTFNINNKCYAVEDREELKNIVLQVYNESFFRNSHIDDLINMPNCTLRNNLVELIIESDYDTSFRKKVETYLLNEANKYSLTSSYRLYVVYACVCCLFDAKLINDIEFIDKMNLALCIVTNIGMSVV
jgi:hypothetical protein